MSEDVAKLMKHAHDLERRGRKMDAELTYAAASEIARLRAELTWQPIETAPKDGTIILLFDEREDVGVGLGHWFALNQETLDYDPIARGWAQGQGGIWNATNGNSICLNHHASVTHWMPLPAPPAALSSARGEVSPQAVSDEVSSRSET